MINIGPAPAALWVGLFQPTGNLHINQTVSLTIYNIYYKGYSLFDTQVTSWLKWTNPESSRHCKTKLTSAVRRINIAGALAGFWVGSFLQISAACEGKKAIVIFLWKVFL